MAVLDVLRGKTEDELRKIPASVESRIKRGKERRDEDRGKRLESIAFYEGDQFKYLDPKGALRSQPTTTSVFERTGKPPHRFRLARNFIVDIMEREVSASTQRVPSYEVNPSTTDPEDISAARLGEKVALYGYDKWRLRRVTEEIVRYALIADEGFAWPYFDNSIGPYIPTEEGPIGQGEICVRTFGANEVGWEPGLPFEDSPWHFIEQAREINAVMQTEGYIGGELKPDAEGKGRLVLVTEYLERPSPQFPEGRWLIMANQKLLAPLRPYPCTDPNGEPIDEPILHRLTWAQSPGKDRGMGLGRHLVDLQRVINDLPNRQLEWVRLALNPQVLIQNSEMKQRLTDEPGAVYQVFGTGDIKWRPVPPIPQELEEIKQAAVADMARIAAQNDIPSNVEAGRAIQALIERDAARRQNFVANLADFHSRLMRHCLYLVQKHYTEERLLKIRGRFGPEVIKDFVGAQLRGQADVTVFPASVEPRTREAMEQRVMNYAQLGWISPEAAMKAVNDGTAEGLAESYELDIGRANSIIQAIRDGTFGSIPPRPVLPNELSAQEGMTEVPGWMPRPFDNVKIHKQVFEDWLKTDDYQGLPPDQQQAANLYYSALLDIETQVAQREAMLQQQQAESLGMANAARPQQASPMPSLPSVNGQQA